MAWSRRPVLGSNLLCYDKFENILFDSIDLCMFHWDQSEVIWLSDSVVCLCKVQHDLYGAHAFWTAMSPQCATVIESWCGSSQTPKYTILAWKQGRGQMGVKVSKAASVN